MFLDRELRAIREAKTALSARCAMRRSLLRLDALSVRARVQGVLSGLRTGLAVAQAIKEWFSGPTGRPG